MIRFTSSLQFKIPTVIIGSFLLILAAIFVVFSTIGKTMLENQAYQQVISSGANIVSELGQRVALAESLATALANLGERLPADAELHRTLVKHVMNYEGTEAFIAGGGLWPAPYRYDAKTERHSFFWGRDQQGKLRYYDDYNNPAGPGYHHEEWYVPAKHLGEGAAFWSKSYMDPYSYQPMVTVTVPMYREGEFYGVSTIDLKLEGLHDFLEEISRAFGGYAFATDRNGKLLSFPDETMTKIYSTDAQGSRTENFITAGELAHKQPQFAPLAQAIEATIESLISSTAGLTTFDESLAASIAADSYQIEGNEARLIAAVLAAMQDTDTRLERQPQPLFIEGDMLLGEPVFAAVFEMPRTFWKIVTVMPYSRAVAESNVIYRNVVSAIVIVMLVSLLVILLVVRKVLVRPIADMSRQLISLTEEGEADSTPLTSTDKGELGKLAFWFNRRSEKLVQVQNELRQAQEKLEQRVAERTEELHQEIEKRKEEELIREGRATRAEKQHAAVVALSRHVALSEGNTRAAARVINETVADSVGVARSSIWLIDENSECLRAVDLYEKDQRRHSDDIELKLEDYPSYVDVLQSHRSVAVFDMLQDERTTELAEYARANQIASLLDSPIRIGGLLRGVVCFEHVGEKRKWHEDEIRFSGEIADQVVQVLANAERIRSEEQIRRLAFYDPLTHLANRRLLQEAVHHELEVARRRSVYGSLLYLDLDNFKTLNDSLGHSVGDELLVQVAERLCAALRKEDTASRLGGDEFVVLLSGEHHGKEHAMEQALAVARKIQEEISKPYRLHGYEHVITTSMGISLYPESNDTAADVLKQADAAMYRAKEDGRNTVCFYNPIMQQQADKRLRLEKELRTAISRQEFELYFQPQVDADGSPLGVEALVRWNHPDRGLETPAGFIPIAEETGLILDLGKYILREACVFSRNHAVGQTAVNISPLQFRQPDFVDTMTAILNETQADPASLTIEVTEGIVIEHIEDTVNKLQSLKAMGICISIDDFGTGYSSLSYLKQLPLDQLKVSNEFVRDIQTDANDAVLVDAIISMARHLGLDVVAEGVETIGQLQFLTEKGCHMFQGYYFSKPLSKDAFDDYLSALTQNRQSGTQ
ncbi:MAG: EAL domain-containing protein [Pseudomonadota bacterium]|nr:MAG: EAL domain-containing protein [Pseudomonadota bacterium]